MGKGVQKARTSHETRRRRVSSSAKRDTISSNVLRGCVRGRGNGQTVFARDGIIRIAVRCGD